MAIDNADLFDNLQKSNRDLEKAYQATLEGWVRALDLRDKETEGHTQRVMILTERLARSMGVEGEALVNITRGALLHDIGKMGIPDAILLKKGALTDEERTLIREHPNMAKKMLKDIEFLWPAIDIPYCHHEKWDGSGYPRGLKGMNIPFAAQGICDHRRLGRVDLRPALPQGASSGRGAGSHQGGLQEITLTRMLSGHSWS